LLTLKIPSVSGKLVDLEDVGFDTTTYMFEMLGNWSFGYFKKRGRNFNQKW
jgi:alanyl-tRNA synthetase